MVIAKRSFMNSIHWDMVSQCILDTLGYGIPVYRADLALFS